MSRRRLELAGRLARNLTSPPLLVAITAMVFVWATLRDVADVRRRADSVRADVGR